MGGVARRSDGGVPGVVPRRRGTACRRGGAGAWHRGRGCADHPRRRPAHRAVDARHGPAGAAPRRARASGLDGHATARSRRGSGAGTGGPARHRGTPGERRRRLLAGRPRYVELADDNAVDPLGHGSTVWMQDLDERKPARHAMHVDVSVAREHVRARLAAALAAGGRVVHHWDAPEAWTLADRAYAAAIAAAGILSVRLYDRFSPRSLGVASFILIAIGLVVVAFTLGNDRSTVVVLGLLVVGIGALRGMANNASNALGAAFASVPAVGLLGVFLASGYSRADLPPELQVQALFHDVNFVADDELRSALDATSATPKQVEEAVAINEDARLRALRASFLIVGAISLSAIFPAWRLPRHAPGELSAEDIVSEAGGYSRVR
ncbi:MAG: hypothetical protein J2P24_06230 [Streptosporangiales bacterium]|nr:hypothetical protein [Streptosporangiales bacterium]MBO0890809.1 hypothetical protein [Acidothermales bacterium]